MLSRQSRADELKKSLDLLARDILQNLRKGECMSSEVMVHHMNNLLLELRSYHALEPIKVTDYLEYFKKYEQEIRTELALLREQTMCALANANRMKENIS